MWCLKTKTLIYINNFVTLAHMIKILIYNQVAPAHMVLKKTVISDL